MRRRRKVSDSKSDTGLPSSLRASCGASSSPVSGRSRRSASTPPRRGTRPYRAAAAWGGSRRSTPRSTPCGSRPRCAASTPATLVPPKEARRMDRNVLLAVAAAQEAWDDAGLDGVDRIARRDPRRVGDRRDRDDRGAAAGLRRARPGPRLAVLHPLRARRHGQRADRDPARPQGAELRAGLRLCDGLDRDRRGGGVDPARPGRRRARRRHRGADHPADPRRLLRDARARRRGGGPDARVTAVRRDAGGVRHGGGGVHPRAGGARGGTRPRRDGLRGGARLRRLERRAPPRPARAGGDRRRRDDRRRARRRRGRAASGSATSTPTGRRRRSAISPRRGRSSRCSATTPTVSRSRRRSR